MKKYIKIFIAVLFLGLLGFMIYKVIVKTQEKKQTEQFIQTLPDFELQKTDGSLLTKSELKPDTETVFVFFNSTCDFCKYEAQSISDSIHLFKNYQLVFVSDEPIETIKLFSETYKLNNYANIDFVFDSNARFSFSVGANSNPYLLIYNKKSELITRHKGQMKPENIIKILQ